MISIRREQPGDEPRIHEVNARAFGREAEAEVVDALRTACPEGVSLVAESDGKIIGHILFTPAVIEWNSGRIIGTGLAPLAVMPEKQRQGVGSALVRAGLEEMRRTGEPFCFLIGHPEYYPRFGFESASKYRIHYEHPEVPDPAVMIVVFKPDILRGVSGTARMRTEFDAAI